MRENIVQEERNEQILEKPYVVSADVRLLLSPWANERGFILPGGDFFSDLRSAFTNRMGNMFPGFELVSEEVLSEGIQAMVDAAGVFPVSLDRVYFNAPFRLDVTRVIGSDGESMGLGRRSDSPYLLSQFRELRGKGIVQVALVDDVIFTGHLIARVSDLLGKMGIAVPYVFAGIGVGEGVDKLSSLGMQVVCVKRYAEVIDEICERDFYPGVPMSGRRVYVDGNIGAPYILPFGDPVSWASIPAESQVAFSRFAIGQSIRLFSAIENASGRAVTCADIERKVVGLPQDDTRFVEALQSVL